jgi:3-oxoacyl-[acyl-carrier protein] reductase
MMLKYVGSAANRYSGANEEMSIGMTKNRAVVLTGANGGIGLALADYLLASGLTELACQYRKDPTELYAVVRRHGLDPERHCFQADLANQGDVRALSEGVNAALGRVWGVINLAGATSNGLSWKLSLEEFERVLVNNLTTTFLTCREFIPAMRDAGGGRIINISSVVAFSGVAGASHYCSAKAGVVGFTKAIARELASKQITANVLALGYFDHGMLYTVPEDLRDGIRQQIPIGRFGTAPEVGGLINHLLSEGAGYTTGQVLHINGGIYG